jgi:hypothetical protein
MGSLKNAEVRTSNTACPAASSTCHTAAYGVFRVMRTPYSNYAKFLLIPPCGAQKVN